MVEASRKSKHAECPEVDPEVELVARMMRTALLSLPAGKKRRDALALIDQLENADLKAPKKGGSTLNNVIRLFKEDRRAEWTADEVLSALDRRGEAADKKSVYNALTYLSSNPSRRILRKAGYGRYQLEDGSWIEGPP